MNYYNEFDPKAAAWIQQLIADKQIPNGIVDTRSITEVTPNDLKGFTQCHFFAGIGGWSLALKLAGVPQDRRVWTASLPCQPFSTAGKQLGTGDERHLAPVFLKLVRQCNPPTIIGEQVASKLARTEWLPGIRLELEALGYSFGAVDLSSPCAGEIGEGRIVRGDQATWERLIIGAPHIRQRLYWVASSGVVNTAGSGLSGRCANTRRQQPEMLGTGSESILERMADSNSGRHEQRDSGQRDFSESHEGSADGRLVHTRIKGSQGHAGDECDGGEPGWQHQEPTGSTGLASWALLPCRDGKTRRIESTLLWMADGFPRGVVPSGDQGAPENSKTEERNQVNAATTDACIGEELRGVSCPNAPEDLAKRIIGGPEGFREPKVLQPEVHGQSHGGGDKSVQRQEWSQASHKDAQGCMRDMQAKRYTAACPSQGRESFEQFSREFDHFVRILSSQVSFTSLHGVSPTTEAVQALLKRCNAGGFVLHPPNAASEAWRSYSSEEREQIWLMVRESGLIFNMTHPLVSGTPRGVVPSGDPGDPKYANATAEARAMRLKGYGNAIQIDTAVLFIQTAFEAIADTTP